MSDATVYRAAWVVPITAPPLRDGWVATADGTIVGIGRGRPAGPVAREVDLGQVALAPGLVNAHTHLELSWLRGRVPPAASMPAWVRTLLRERAQEGDGRAAIEAALDEAIASGTVAFGDVTNSLASVAPLAARGVDAVVFHEILGFDPAVAEERVRGARDRLRGLPPAAVVRYRLVPHAPYSTSPELIRALSRERTGEWPVTSIHVAESAEEVRFLADGSGPWRDLLGELAAVSATWTPPRERPARYLDGLGLWAPGAMAVHGVHLDAFELGLLAERDVTLVTCPRSNRWVGAGAPPVASFAASHVRVAIGTDSLASAPDLNLFEELRTLHELAPDIPARTLLSWATLNGARALGLDAKYGSLSFGRRARFLAIEMAAGVTDVEQALVSGVTPREVSWVDAFEHAPV